MSFDGREATDKQYAMMEKLGIDYNPKGVSIGEARMLIANKLGKPLNDFKDVDSAKPRDITSNYSQEKSSPSLDKDTLIVRQSCLKAAVEVHVCYIHDTKTIQPIDMITKMAEEFEKWVFRDGK